MSSSSVVAIATAKTSRVAFTSAIDSSDALVTISGGQHALLFNYFSPLHQEGWFSTSPPRLPRSGGFSEVPTCRQITSECACIFSTLLLTNCLYVPGDLIQCRATVLSSQQYFSIRGNPSRAEATFAKRFTAICPDTNSSRGIVSPLLESLALAALSP